MKLTSCEKCECSKVAGLPCGVCMEERCKSLAKDAMQHKVFCPVLPAEPPSGYVRVRVAVAVDTAGQWAAYGNWDESDDEVVKGARYRSGDAISWLIADVPIPTVPTITATVVPVEKNP